jgi:hypothetical protein
MSQALKRGDIVRLKDGSMYGVIEKDVTESEQTAKFIFVKVNGHLAMLYCEQDEIFVVEGINMKNVDDLPATMRLLWIISGIYKGLLSLTWIIDALKGYQTYQQQFYRRNRWDEVEMMSMLRDETWHIDNILRAKGIIIE